MSTGSTPKEALPSPQQEVRIDLPGEKVEVWLSGPRLLVTLRKHRDVILELKLGKGKTYTVESTISDFYNANSKKIIFANRKEIITFKDGERLHLWITRNFKGHLVIKCENEIMMKIEPNKIDQHQYDDDSKTKPAPIIINLGQDPRPLFSTLKKTSIVENSTNTLKSPAQAIPHPVAAPTDQECSLVCVVEGRLTDAPQKILDYFKKGGGKSGIADVDINDVATRNWILGQIAGTAAYARDNWEWLRASINRQANQSLKLVRAQVHMVRGKMRFYFSGYSKLNIVFGPGGFGSSHERVISIFAGVGKTSSSFKAVGQGVLGSIKGNALVSFIFSSATAVAEWKDDLSKDGYDLAANLLMGLVKTLVAAAITVAVVAAIIVIVMVVASASLSVLAVGALTVSVGIGINYAIDAADKMAGRAITGDKQNTDGVSGLLAPLLRKAGKEIEESWMYLMKKFPNDYKEIVF
jgi:hypothetical protein